MSLFSIPFTVKRSIEIEKPLEAVFDRASNFSEMAKWSPWLVMEKSASVGLRGSDGTVGAVHVWEGEILGAGELEMTSITKNELITADLRIIKPWKSNSKIRYEFSDREGKTQVSWVMEGHLPLFMGWMKKSMEAWIGMDYLRGLLMLKEYCETGEVLSNVEIKPVQESSGFNYIGVNTKCTIDEVGEAMQRDFEKLHGYMKEHDIHSSGTVFSIYHDFNVVKQNCHYTSGFSTKAARDVSEGFVSGRVEGGKALVIEHTGSYQNLGNAWTAGYCLLRAKKMKLKKGHDPLEVYLNDPAETADKDLKTVLYFPLK